MTVLGMSTWIGDFYEKAAELIRADSEKDGIYSPQRVFSSLVQSKPLTEAGWHLMLAHLLQYASSAALCNERVDDPDMRTPAQALQWMDEQGLSKAELARRFGVSCSLVSAILASQKKCRRGASHNIAVFLGLKHGQPVAAKQPYSRAGKGAA